MPTCIVRVDTCLLEPGHVWECVCFCDRVRILGRMYVRILADAYTCVCVRVSACPRRVLVR